MALMRGIDEPRMLVSDGGKGFDGKSVEDSEYEDMV